MLTSTLSPLSGSPLMFLQHCGSQFYNSHQAVLVHLTSKEKHHYVITVTCPLPTVVLSNTSQQSSAWPVHEQLYKAGASFTSSTRHSHFTHTLLTHISHFIHISNTSLTFHWQLSHFAHTLLTSHWRCCNHHKYPPAAQWHQHAITKLGQEDDIWSEFLNTKTLWFDRKKEQRALSKITPTSYFCLRNG